MQKCAKEIHEEAHLQDKPGPIIDVGGAQAHLGTDHVKAIARWRHQATGAPGVRSNPCHYRLSPSPLAVACHHATSVHGGFLFYLRQTDHILV